MKNVFDFKVTKSGWMLHLFNSLSVYKEVYLTSVTTEYWSGHSRKRVLKFGNVTVWIKK